MLKKILLTQRYNKAIELRYSQGEITKVNREIKKDRIKAKEDTERMNFLNCMPLYQFFKFYKLVNKRSTL